MPHLNLLFSLPIPSPSLVPTQVLNRFSSDVETLDKNLMDSLGWWEGGKKRGREGGVREQSTRLLFLLYPRVAGKSSSSLPPSLPLFLLPSLPGSFVECCLNALAVVGVIAFRLPILLVGLLPLLLVAGVVARLYLTSSREMKRLESNR